MSSYTTHRNYRHYTNQAGGAAYTHANPESVWKVVSEIGGTNRYYAMNSLWTMREWLDSMVGGMGRQHSRPVGRPIQAGDRIDSWRVQIAEAPSLLVLEFGMKAPGQGVLEFTIEPKAQRTRITATAFWQPQGLPGKLYWAAMMPAHIVLFKRLTAEIARRAEVSQIQP